MARRRKRPLSAKAQAALGTFDPAKHPHGAGGRFTETPDAPAVTRGASKGVTGEHTLRILPPPPAEKGKQNWPTRGREGSRFSNYATGQSVDEAVAAVERHYARDPNILTDVQKAAGGVRKQVLKDLTWAHHRGLVAFDPPAGAGARPPAPPPKPPALPPPPAKSTYSTNVAITSVGGPGAIASRAAFEGYESDTLAKAFKKAGPLWSVSDTNSGAWSAHYQSRARHIHIAARRGTSDYNLTWRHEYGHHIDFRAGGDPTTAHENTVGELPKVRAAIGLDANRLDDGPRGVDTSDSKLRVSLMDAESPEMLRTNVNSALRAAGTGMDYDDVVALMPKARDIDVVVVTDHLTHQRFREALQAVRDRSSSNTEFSQLTPVERTAVIEATAKKTEPPFREPMDTLIFTADMAGAATRNRVGWGHPEKYYDQARNNQSTEVVANYWTVAAHPGPTPVSRAYYRLSRYLMPHSTRVLDDYFGSL